MQEVNKWADSITISFTSGRLTGWENWIRELLDKFCREGSDPLYCSAALERGVQRLHDELNARDLYLGVLEEASRFEPRDRQPWGWHPLIDTPLLQAGLISLHRFFPVPLHDHPNAWGAQQVVSGKVRIRQYQFTPDSNRQQTLVSLEQLSDRILIKGQNSAFTPSFRNLHELNSNNLHSVILSMMVNPYRQQDRSWYYQVPLSLHGNKGLYNRIRKRPAMRVQLDSMTR